MAYDFSPTKKVAAPTKLRERRRAFALTAAASPIPLIDVQYTTHQQSDIVWRGVGLSGESTVRASSLHRRRRAFALAAAACAGHRIDAQYATKYQRAVAWRGVAVGLSAVGVFSPIATATSAMAAEKQAGMQVGLVIVGGPANVRSGQQAKRNAVSQADVEAMRYMRPGYTLTKGAAAEIASRRASMIAPNS